VWLARLVLTVGQPEQPGHIPEAADFIPAGDAPGRSRNPPRRPASVPPDCGCAEMLLGGRALAEHAVPPGVERVSVFVEEGSRQ
jgi:hypothetical protein